MLPVLTLTPAAAAASAAAASAAALAIMQTPIGQDHLHTVSEQHLLYYHRRAGRMLAELREPLDAANTTATGEAGGLQPSQAQQ